MASVEFGYGEKDEHGYVIDGTDFKHLYDRWKSDNDLTDDDLPPVWVQTDDGLSEQVTPYNVRIHINEVSDEHDNISVYDPRDGLWFSLFREKFIRPPFDDVVSMIGHAALIIHSTLPLEQIVKQHRSELTGDIGDYVPKDW